MLLLLAFQSSLVLRRSTAALWMIKRAGDHVYATVRRRRTRQEGEPVGIEFSWRARTGQLPISRTRIVTPHSSRHFTLSPFAPPLLPSHRRLDKGSSSVDKEGSSRWRPPWFYVGGDEHLVFLTLAPFSCLVFVMTRDLAFLLSLPFSLSPSFFLSSSLSFRFSISHCRLLLAVWKGSRARGKPAVKLKHDEGSFLDWDARERDSEGVKKNERRGRRRQQRRRRRS